MSTTCLRLAIVVTVLNEIDTISDLTSSLTHQSLKPNEVVIVDGGSNDGTWEYLQKQKTIKSFRKQGNRSVGRNFGVAKSSSPIIAFTDAGCVPESNWLEELTRPFADAQVSIVSGYYKGLPQHIFEKCLVPYVLVMPDKIPREFFPSTRSMALRKNVWDKSGGFNKKLSHNEDYEFAHRLKRLGYSFTFSPKAIVSWRPRSDLKSAAWMWLRFAIGDAQSGILRPKVKLLALRYYVFFFLFFLNHWLALLAIPYLIWAIFKNYRYVKDLRAIFWLPVLQLTSDIMVLFGTIVGLLSRG